MYRRLDVISVEIDLPNLGTFQITNKKLDYGFVIPEMILIHLLFVGSQVLCAIKVCVLTLTRAILMYMQ